MVRKLLQILSIRCSHKHTSQPFMAASATGAHSDWEPVVGTGYTHYIVCLDCGQKFAYDWRNMRVVR